MNDVRGGGERQCNTLLVHQNNRPLDILWHCGYSDIRPLVRCQGGCVRVGFREFRYDLLAWAPAARKNEFAHVRPPALLGYSHFRPLSLWDQPLPVPHEFLRPNRFGFLDRLRVGNVGLVLRVEVSPLLWLFLSCNGRDLAGCQTGTLVVDVLQFTFSDGCPNRNRAGSKVSPLRF